MDKEYEEVEKIHLPQIIKYLVTIAHEGEVDGAESIGSGVKLRYGTHHLVVTAAHCIKRNPRVMRDENFYQSYGKKLVTQPPVPVLEAWKHDRLDIGFLELNEAFGVELGESQLFTGQLTGGNVFVAGNPVCELQTFEKLKEKNIIRTVFGSSIKEQSSDFIRLGYPEMGSKYENGEWVEAPFIHTPHGFSGGGCFAIPVGERARVRIINYLLLGIQTSWHRVERWVEIVPIQHLLDHLRDRYGSTD